MKTTLTDAYITKGTVISFDVAVDSPIDKENSIDIVILDEHKVKVHEGAAAYSAEDEKIYYTFNGTEALETVGNYYIFFRDAKDNYYPLAENEIIIMSVLGFQRADDDIIEVIFIKGKVFLKNFNV